MIFTPKVQPEDGPESPESGSDSKDLIADFMDRVNPQRLGENLKRISKKPHYATSVGDYELSQMVKEQWASTLDDAWIVEYEIMHQWPVEENSFAKLVIDGDETPLAQKEKTDEDDVLMIRVLNKVLYFMNISSLF